MYEAVAKASTSSVLSMPRPIAAMLCKPIFVCLATLAAGGTMMRGNRGWQRFCGVVGLGVGGEQAGCGVDAGCWRMGCVSPATRTPRHKPVTQTMLVLHGLVMGDIDCWLWTSLSRARERERERGTARARCACDGKSAAGAHVAD
eukprot:3249242-Rhodomonas_salina.1